MKNIALVAPILLIASACGADDNASPATTTAAVDTSWRELNPGPTPPARESHGADRDPVTKRMYVFGGSGEGGDLTDVWALQLA